MASGLQRRRENKSEGKKNAHTARLYVKCEVFKLITKLKTNKEKFSAAQDALRNRGEF